MSTNLFLESAAEHAERIGLPEDHTQMLRRALTLKRAGYPPESVFVQMGADNVTWAVAVSTVDELELELDVLWENNRYIPEDLTAPAAPPQAGADVEQRPTRVGKKQLLAQYGLYQGKQPPYGYLFDCEVRIKTADGRVVTGHSLIPDPDTEAIVADIFVQFTAGLAPDEIAADLNVCGIASPEGSYWDEDYVYAIVHQAALYAGFSVYRGSKHQPAHRAEILYPGRHEALIDGETTLKVFSVTGQTLKWTFGPTWQIYIELTEELQ
ncbi:MAG TPA: recombinase family protein [Anaerolineae bacterium]|nr:recombinase family protein [Anaerolineae bacterium]HQI83388.1 recombinase family protein [Anaerolineae bacterium]